MTCRTINPYHSEQRLSLTDAAPMSGIVVKLLVEPGVAVEKGQPVVIMEAMKMEHTLCAPTDGSVLQYFFQAGDQVDGGTELVEFSPSTEN